MLEFSLRGRVDFHAIRPHTARSTLLHCTNAAAQRRGFAAAAAVLQLTHAP